MVVLTCFINKFSVFQIKAASPWRRGSLFFKIGGVLDLMLQRRPVHAVSFLYYWYDRLISFIKLLFTRLLP